KQFDSRKRSRCMPRLSQKLNRMAAVSEYSKGVESRNHGEKKSPKDPTRSSLSGRFVVYFIYEKCWMCSHHFVSIRCKRRAHRPWRQQRNHDLSLPLLQRCHLKRRSGHAVAGRWINE